MLTSQTRATEPEGIKNGFRRILYSRRLFRLLLIAGLSALYLFTRAFNLTLLPPFVDEMVYSHWADQMQFMNPLNVASSAHGPLHPLLILFLGKLFSLNLMLAGRLLSLIFGLVTMWLLYGLGAKLWGVTTGVCAAILYIFSPFILTYNRLGLMEAIQGLFMVGSFYLALVLAGIKNSRWNLTAITLGLGLLMGAAMLIKLNSIIVIIWVGLALTFYGGIRLQGKFSWKFKDFLQIDGLKWLALLISCLIGLAIFSIQFAMPLYFEENFDTYQFSFREVLFSAGTTWWPRLIPYIGSTIGPYLTWPVTIISGLGLLLSTVGLFLSHHKALQRNSLKAFILVIAGLIALAPPLFLLRFNAPRYLFSGLLLFFPVAGWFITEVSQFLLKKLRPKGANFNFSGALAIGLACLVSLAAIPFMVNLVTNPDAVKFPPQDDVQFLSGWPAGNELASFSRIVHQVTAENFPKTIQMVNIDANSGANNYKMMLYLSLNPAPNGVTTPSNLEFKQIPFNPDLAYFNGRLFNNPEIRQDRLTLVEIQSSDEQRLRWSKNNPEFKLVAQFNKPAKLAFWLYRFDPPIAG